MDKKFNEKRVAAASYILSFYEEVNNVTHYYSIYLNALIELDTKYSKIESNELMAKVPDEDKNQLIQLTNYIRYHSNKCYIQYKTLLPKLNIKEDKKLTNFFNSITTTYIIQRAELQEFVLTLHSVLMDGIIQELLESSQSYLENLYGQAPESGNAQHTE